MRDEEAPVGKVAVHCAEVLGVHMEPAAWADIVLPRLTTPGLSVSDQIGMLIVAGGLLRGSGQGKVGATLESLVNVTASNVVSGVQNAEMVEEIFLLAKDVLGAAQLEVADSLACVFLRSVRETRSWPHMLGRVHLQVPAIYHIDQRAFQHAFRRGTVL